MRRNGTKAAQILVTMAFRMFHFKKLIITFDI